jgi:tRNA-splicing ligase RtcB
VSKFKVTSIVLKELGYKPGPIFGLILTEFSKEYKFYSEAEQKALLAKVLSSPKDFYDVNGVLSKIAFKLAPPPVETPDNIFDLNETEVKKTVYGADNIEKGAFDQIDIAARLPVAVQASLMPDAHQGYGLPIGGVLAADNAVIPYGVGVDIGCRMAMTLYDIPEGIFKSEQSRLKKVLKDHTFFGTGVSNDKPVEAEVLENKLFGEIEIIKKLKDTAWRQLGTSGSGNHFVDLGIVDLDYNLPMGLNKKRYLAIMSHSGSRGLGANIANYYTKMAKKECVLPKEAQHLAWLDLDSELGQEYWLGMNLAGDYAQACHDEIHRRLAKELGWKSLFKIENHHNFAWKEKLNGKEVIVHRKGATPAGLGMLGIIPGSMATEAFIVAGKGNVDSINSASHGAGRLMSRTAANKTLTKSDMKSYLKKQNVVLIGGGLDESPEAYKDINQVMADQSDLVDIVGTFRPRMVRMAGD